MTVVADTDPRTIPGALAEHMERTIPGSGTITFEQAPSGWLTKDGEIRRKDHRAYYWQPEAQPCGDCDGTGRVPGVRANTTKKCAKCKGEGDTARRARLPSVTTLLDSACPKPGLAPWAEKQGIRGAIEAVRLGLIDPHDPASAAMAVEIVKDRRLGADAARDEAAGRGLDIHACLEHYMTTGEPPNPADHVPEHHGYVKAFVRWLLAADPEPVAVEELVAHPDHGYAGRVDLRAYTRGALATIDAKTQERGGIYLAAHAQVNLYERAAVWCGDPPADRKFVVVFAANGEFREMPADHDDAFTDAALAWIGQSRPIDQACNRANMAEIAARKAVAA